MERIVFVIPNISGGGSARVASLLLSHWEELGHEVHLVTFEDAQAKNAYAIDPRVIRHRIGLYASPPGMLGMLSTNLARVRRLRQLFRRLNPTAIISFLLDANAVVVLAARGMNLPLLISERNHPAHDQVSTMKKVIRRCTYPLASRICVQTEGIRTWFAANLGVEASVIPNPVTIPAATGGRSRPARADNGIKRAVSLGRLEPQKGFDRLVTAFAQIAAKVPDWELVVFGEGAQRAALERQIHQAGLSGRVKLPGSTSTPWDELKAADLYIHPARFEGFPNAVLEALASSLCVVATDCPGAMREILNGGEYGLLVPDDIGALACAMGDAMTDEALRARYAAKAAEAVVELSVPRIACLWLDMIARWRTSPAATRRATAPAATPSRLT
jgi:GalNAc-alpha-(1->4)-GalNAc-alpha-(1->3)-diNAcBac-PP-undecaprenol alpha-1,4-N-acetyl-D-galactosaminyltransferase